MISTDARAWAIEFEIGAPRKIVDAFDFAILWRHFAMHIFFSLLLAFVVSMAIKIDDILYVSKFAI